MSLRQAFNPLSSRFFTTTVHELRTPIQSIIGTTELLQQTELDKEQAEYYLEVRRQQGYNGNYDLAQMYC